MPKSGREKRSRKSAEVQKVTPTWIEKSVIGESAFGSSEENEKGFRNILDLFTSVATVCAFIRGRSQTSCWFDGVRSAVKNLCGK